LGRALALAHLPKPLLRETGLFLIAYAALVGWLGTGKPCRRHWWNRDCRNAAWTIASIALCSQRGDPEPLGEVFVAAAGDRGRRLGPNCNISAGAPPAQAAARWRREH